MFCENAKLIYVFLHFYFRFSITTPRPNLTRFAYSMDGTPKTVIVHSDHKQNALQGRQCVTVNLGLHLISPGCRQIADNLSLPSGQGVTGQGGRQHRPHTLRRALRIRVSRSWWPLLKRSPHLSPSPMPGTHASALYMVPVSAFASQW